MNEQSTTGIVETAAIGVGIAVKKGTAATGIVAADAQASILGIVAATDFNESVAVGEQASILSGGLGMAVCGASVLAKGTDLCTDANGKMVPISGVTPAIQISGTSIDITPSGTSIGYVNRAGIAEAAAIPGELFAVTITRDQVAVVMS